MSVIIKLVRPYGQLIDIKYNLEDNTITYIFKVNIENIDNKEFLLSYGENAEKFINDIKWAIYKEIEKCKKKYIECKESDYLDELIDKLYNSEEGKK